MQAIRGRVGSLLVGVATAILIVTVSILPFLTPAWVGFEQERAQARAWTGYSVAELRAATEPILHDLAFGGDFTVEVNGQPVLTERERAHMSDVRSVFRGLWVLTAVAVVVLVAAAFGVSIGRLERRSVWRSVRGGALGLVIGVVAVGAVGLVAFDQLFETFHEVFFPAGSYLFDPATDRLVQLFPFQFWDETALVAGAAIIAVAVLVAVTAGRRTRLATPANETADLTTAAEPGT